MAAASTKGRHYAPPDPTLPCPWRALVDGNTGYIYFWNPETKVTQYERPVIAADDPSPPPQQQQQQLPQLREDERTKEDGIVPDDNDPSSTVPLEEKPYSYVDDVMEPVHDHGKNDAPCPLEMVGPSAHSESKPSDEHTAAKRNLSESNVPSGDDPVRMQPPADDVLEGNEAPADDVLEGNEDNINQNRQQLSGLHDNEEEHTSGLHENKTELSTNPKSMSRSPKRTPYAAADPTLPKPWKALIDRNTGYMYFWNPETKVTQYERPQAPSPVIYSHKAEPISEKQNCDHCPLEMAGSSVHSELKPSDEHTTAKGNLNESNVPSSGESSMLMQPPASDVLEGNEIDLNQNSLQSSSLHANEEQQQPSGLQENKTDLSTNPGDASSLSRSPKRTPYAAADPTLPKPWRALIDKNTGYMYFWNPETKVTQYERPQTPPTSILYSQKAESISEKQNYHHHDSVTNDRADDSSMKSNQDTPVGEDNARNCSSPQVALSGELYRRKHEITINGSVVLDPYITFQSTGFPPEILKEVRSAGFSAPTPIQAQSWPFALKGRDIVAVAKTGSGKTLGYLIPGFILLKRLQNDSKGGPTVLILSPTRELATQIQDEAVKFGASSRISCTCLYGGAPKGPQLKELDHGTNIVVATPGRLNDILEMNRVNLSQVSYLVLDEADRMLDMGFEPQLRKILKQIPPRRQTLMFTATWPKEVCRIAADLLVNPVQINIGIVDELVANKAITQHVEVITPMEKNRRLEQILRSQDPGSKIIIFCSTKRMCDQLANNLNRKFGAAAIHGDKSQSDRDKVLSQFRSGQSPILVATDVAARGLDIKDVRVVINYDFPTGVEDYVHRIGRTGRAGASGVAYTFFSERDSKYASDLVKILVGANQCIPSQLKDMMSHGGYGCKSRQWSSSSSAVQSKSSFSSSANESFRERFHGGKQDEHRNAGSNWGDSHRSRSRSPIGSGQSARW